jgi:hypothetical protein
MKFEEFQKLLETGEIPDDIPSLLQATWEMHPTGIQVQAERCLI